MSLLLTAAMTSLFTFASPDSAKPPEAEVGKQVGQFYPDFELPTIDGASTIRLSELRGKKLLLIEFASW